MNESLPPKSRWTRKRAAFVAAVLVVAFPLIALPVVGLDVENDVETWLPQGDADARVLHWFHEHFGDEARMLVSWEGASLNDPLVDRFATAVAGPRDEDGERHGGLESVAEARTPQDVIFRMLENDVDRDEAVRRLSGLLIGPGMMHVRLTDAGRAELPAIKGRIADVIREQTGVQVDVVKPEEAPAKDSESAQFEGEEFAGPKADDPYPQLPHDFQLRWPGQQPHLPVTEQIREVCLGLNSGEGPLIEDCFFAPREPVAVSIVLTAEGDENVRTTLEQIRQTAIDSGIPEESLRLGGTPVGRNELNQQAKASVWNARYPAWMIHKRSPVILSTVLSVLLAFAVLHSVRLALLVLVTSLYAALVATALVPLSGTTLNMVLVVMPNLLFVLTTSGAIHVANYWQHAATEDPKTAISRAVRMATQPCALASITTAIGLASLLTSLLLPVKQFGVFSAVGCVLSLAMVLLVFPSLMVLWPGSPPRPQDVDRSGWRRLGGWLSQHARFVSVSCLLMFVVSAYGLRYFQTQTKVIRYFRRHMRIVHDYEFLEEKLSGILPLEVVIVFPESVREELDSAERLEVVRKIEARLSEDPEISGTLSLADFRPQLEPPSRRAPFAIKARYNRTVRGLNEYLESSSETEEHGFVATTATPIEFVRGGQEIVVTPGTELWRIRAQTSVLSETDYDLVRDGAEAAATEVLANVPGAQHIITGTVPLFLRTQEAVLESLIRSFGLAFAVIAVVMMVLLRSFAAGIITMLPNLLPVVVVFGMVSWAGMRVDIGTMITASVALGIAIDGTLHLLTWFRDGLMRGLSRTEAISLGLAHCGPAMWQTSAIIGIGLLVLGGSDLLLISRFGWLMAALIGAALIADIVFLPALLAGPLGGLIEKRCVQRAGADDHADLEAPITAERRESEGVGIDERAAQIT